MNHLLRLYYTLKPLKGRQWKYRLIQPILKKWSSLCRVSPADLAAARAQPALALATLAVNAGYKPAGNEFTFLNLSAAFPDGIDWNYTGHGMLWLYNLNYFEWLYDDRLSVDDRLHTIRTYVAAKNLVHAGLDGYPTSLRIVAWVRFLLRYDVGDDGIFTMLYQHADWLCRFPEYHLDGNHLWENALALTVAGMFFKQDRFYRTGKRLLSACLAGQLFEDGGHVEGSPMYHSLLLWRLLQCIEIMRAIPMEQDGWGRDLERAAEKMLGWLRAVTFSDGTWPAVNDSTAGVAPPTCELEEYARGLGLNAPVGMPGDSGYRMIRSEAFELFIDAAAIRPGYQPGHAHADLGTFCLHVHGKPFIVDTGVSTYTAGMLRQYQRSTLAHNAFCSENRNSSDVWKNFRVGKRAYIANFYEYKNSVELTYRDYSNEIYKRIFTWNDGSIIITDLLQTGASRSGKALLHFDPDIAITNTGYNTYKTQTVEINFTSESNAKRSHCKIAYGFNDLKDAPCLEATITGKTLITIFRII